MSQKEASRRTRQLIVETAGAVFAEKGFNGATIADVYQRLGLTKGAFYYYFTGKEELAQAVLAGQIDTIGFPLVPRSTRLQELIDKGMLFAVHIRSDPILQGSLRLSLERGSHHVDRLRPYQDWIAHNRFGLGQAKECGELYAHVDLDAVAHLFVGAFTGVQVLSEVLTDWEDLEMRVSVLLKHIMPIIALPTVLAELDMAPGRADRVVVDLERYLREQAEAAAESEEQAEVQA
ncbi:ScbR family autoregulator-binding transcription factor [Streptomyces sp. NPDC056773]|uniref:ScbR family autoregulator-binding transcription factor n=1 Tax=unclassified Streptomyces TaxID=2593676 RepID=UPI003678E508